MLLCPRLLLTGVPAVGKTTVVQGVLARMRSAAVSVVGFVTRELLEGGGRVGFVIESLDGPRAVLAHVDYLTGPQVVDTGWMWRRSSRWRC